MKGVLLAGGTGSRLLPLTKVTNKHLLPVWDKPMIYYPLQTLCGLGVREILIITGTEHCGHVSQLLGDGQEFGVEISYRVQDKAGGIGQALGLAEGFCKHDKVAVILGDNIFEDRFRAANLSRGAKVYLSRNKTPQRFGVAEVKDNRIVSIEEKPKNPRSDLAVTGLYEYDERVFDIIKGLKPSARGEIEITDVNKWYMEEGTLQYQEVSGRWTDAGTFESLFAANAIAKSFHQT